LVHSQGGSGVGDTGPHELSEVMGKMSRRMQAFLDEMEMESGGGGGGGGAMATPHRDGGAGSVVDQDVELVSEVKKWVNLLK
jgi:hypothetical protein